MRILFVSIHLMLLFIPVTQIQQPIISSFNTSHVTLYQIKEIKIIIKYTVSIHLMLLFIMHRHILEVDHSSVSIHLMLLFIRNGRNRGQVLYHVSIHLMLLFIKDHQDRTINKIGFQYISCYSLSKSVGYRMNLPKRFNTSHVTLYQIKVTQECLGDLVSIHLMLLFIVSCRI